MEKNVHAAPRRADIILRRPQPTDAVAANRLIAGCPPLDNNSVYCNLLQCTHFSGTSCAATLAGELVGFLSAYLQPDRPDTLFVWQVAVGDAVRGRGIARAMLHEILRRKSCLAVRQLQTTITPDNDASWSLFHSLAEDLGVACHDSRHFLRDDHFAGQHNDEYLLTVGPWITQRERHAAMNHILSATKTSRINP